jgi:predicted RecA/RadA family phage recombinase
MSAITQIAKYVREDNRQPLAIAATVTKGDIIISGDIIGVALDSGVSGDTIDISTRGAYLIAKDTSTFTAGAAVYYDTANDVATSTSASNTFIGLATQDTATDEAGVITVLKGGIPAGIVPRSALVTEASKYPVALTSAYVWDAPQTRIPATPANDDLGLIYGTLGTADTYISTGDAKAATVTRYTGFEVDVPHEYVAGSAALLRLNANLMTTVADTSASLDIEVYRVGAPTVDICSTAAKNMLAGGGGGGLTATDYDFNLTATDLVPGDKLIVRVKIAIVDGATGTAVIGRINSLTRVFNSKG